MDPVEDQFKHYVYPLPGQIEIHMLWTDTPCFTTCWNDGNAFHHAMRSEKIEFILVQHPWMENDSIFADIILPSNTKFEEDDIGADHWPVQYNCVYLEEKCIEPRGETMSDYEIVGAIADKLGYLKEYTEGKSIRGMDKTWFRWLRCCRKRVCAPGNRSRKEILCGADRSRLGENTGRYD